MKTRISGYIENQLGNTKQTAEVKALKEELISNMEEKYSDLLAKGYSEDRAFDKVVSDAGDIRSLLSPGSAGSSAGIYDGGPSGFFEKIYAMDHAVYWPAVLGAYLLISFATGLWRYTWLIFLYAPAFKLENRYAQFYTFITAVYLTFSMIFGFWHLSWIIFPFSGVIFEVMYKNSKKGEPLYKVLAAHLKRDSAPETTEYVDYTDDRRN